LSRAISVVENRAAGHREILACAYRAGGAARVVGVTGPPGAGKSTLVDALTAHWAQAGEPVAVLAVDPASPFSGGAVLGDRVRMDRSADLPGVYVRSLSARGEGGGLSAAVWDVLAVLGEAGFHRVLLETVGAGQADVAIADAADCTVVVGVPGLGDHVQAAKAGLMEIGDLYVVNKADLPGAVATAAQIDTALSAAYAGEPGVNAVSPGFHGPQPATSPGRRALMSRHGDPSREATVWRPPTLLVSAGKGEGIPELAASVDAFLAWSEAGERMRARRRARIRSLVARELGAALLAPYLDPGEPFGAALADWVERVLDGQVSPVEAAAALAAREAPAPPPPRGGAP
jgi:LAO/AO transport system kinase